MISNVFKESSGDWSMRRLLAFLFGLASIACGAVAIHLKMDWKVIAAGSGVPGVICLLLLLFTTWDDIALIVHAVKGNENK